MVYNLTPIEATNTSLGFMQESNNLADGMIGIVFSIVFFVIIFAIFSYSDRQFGKALIISGFTSFFVTGFLFLAARLVEWYLPILYLVATIFAIILQTKGDTRP